MKRVGRILSADAILWRSPVGTYRKYCLPYIKVTLQLLNNKETEKICTIDYSYMKVDKEVRLMKAVDRINCSVHTEEKRTCFWQPLNYQLTECTTDFLNLCIYRRRSPSAVCVFVSQPFRLCCQCKRRFKGDEPNRFFIVIVDLQDSCEIKFVND
jgi:hypothetical protein